MNTKVKIFITIFCYISGVMAIVSAVLQASATPAAMTSAIVYGILGVLFLIAGIVLSRKPRY